MSQKQRVLFISEQPWERQAKLAHALRDAGMSVMLLHIAQPTFDASKYFDYVLPCASPWEVLDVAMRLNPDIIHLFSMASDRTAVAIAQNTRAKLVYDYKDLFENVIVDPPDKWRWETQRYLVERADGICARDGQIDNYSRVNNVELKKPVLHFPDYCHGMNFSRKQKLGQGDDIHVVMVGTFIPEDVFPQWASHGLYMIAQAMAEQRIYLHVYPTAWTLNAMYRRNESIYVDLASKTEYFTLHQTVPVERLIEEISRYDFGAVLYQGAIAGMPENFLLNRHYEYGTAARMFDYVEAGLDVVVQDTLTNQAAFLTKHQFGSIVDKNFIHGDMRSQLLQWKRDPARKMALARAREELTVGSHVAELLELYRAL